MHTKRESERERAAPVAHPAIAAIICVSLSSALLAAFVYVLHVPASRCVVECVAMWLVVRVVVVLQSVLQYVLQYVCVQCGLQSVLQSAVRAVVCVAVYD